MEQLALRVSELKTVVDAHRVSDDITIVAATKTISPELINRLPEFGILDIGENRVQEYLGKREQLDERFRLHMIGQLQSNKAADIAPHAALIQSLDRISLASALQKQAEALGRAVPVLLEVSAAGEAQKAGVPIGEAEAFLAQIRAYEGIKVIGLMTVAPITADLQHVRPVFKAMSALFTRLRDKAIAGVEMRHLSMGMSADFTVALEEGSNMIRVGTALFGPRKAP